FLDEPIVNLFARRTNQLADELDKFFGEVIGELIGAPSEEIHDRLVKKLLAGSGSTRRWPTDVEMIESSISREVAGRVRTTALRHILERIEITLRTKKSESVGLPARLQIEHVLPQNWST